jgi:putative transposase
LTFSCRGRIPLFQSDAIKDAFAAHLAELQMRRSFRLIAWVVMPDHVHVLLIPDLPHEPIPVLLNDLKRPFAERVIRRLRALEAPVLRRLTDARGHVRFWERGGGYDRNIFTRAELLEKVNYIHTNPVRRGLVSAPIEWRWSSAAWWSGDRTGPVRIDLHSV